MRKPSNAGLPFPPRSSGFPSSRLCSELRHFNSQRAQAFQFTASAGISSSGIRVHCKLTKPIRSKLSSSKFAGERVQALRFAACASQSKQASSGIPSRNKLGLAKSQDLQGATSETVESRQVKLQQIPASQIAACKVRHSLNRFRLRR